jgi:CRISPR/Cas system CSM-associated protein Csm2 small subunit
MLTLLFPVAGGICFSVGWRKLIRYLRFRSVDGALKAAESEFKSEELSCEQVRAALAGLEARRAREIAEYASGDAYADMLVGLYLHGYERGRNVPETVDAGASLYERCEKALNKLLAGKLRVRYWEVNPSQAHDVK